jgi:hypothetical protein
LIDFNGVLMLFDVVCGWECWGLWGILWLVALSFVGDCKSRVYFRVYWIWSISGDYSPEIPIIWAFNNWWSIA